jgi:folate-binding protein YgfZ
VVADYGELESEYASVRRGAALMDCPHRGVLIVAGAERRDFLDRMLTQNFKGLDPGTCCSSFWLNRKGRIEADLLCIETGSEILLDLDIHQAAATTSGLSEYIFSEDAKVEDLSSSWHRLALHGPAAAAHLAAVLGQPAWTLGPGRAARVTIAGTEVTVARRDLLAEVGLELLLPRTGVEAVWDLLLRGGQASVDRIRPVGWHAFNIARIEAGAPLFNIDFDSTCLPHETGVLHDRVSFTKGCYLGQEIVARMQSLGRPKREVVGLRFEPLGNSAPQIPAAVNSSTGGDLARSRVLPEAGSSVHALEGTGQEAVFGEPVGQVTSSTFSPMLGAAPIALAMVRSSHSAPGTRLAAADEGERVAAVVGPLRRWPPAALAPPDANPNPNPGSPATDRGSA